MGYKKRYRKGRSLAAKAYHLAKRTRRDLQAETKHIDRYNIRQIPATVGSIENLNWIALGDGDSDRDGSEIRYTNLLARFHLEQSTDQSAVTRVMIFRVLSDSNNAVGTPPTMHGVSATDILDVASPLSALDWENRKTYQVLYDELLAGNADATDNWAWKVNIKLKRGDCHFKTGALGTSGKGGLFLGMFTDGTTTGDNPSLNWHIRIKYVDN